MANNDFLPKDYKRPRGDSNYLKLKDGDNITFRIMSAPIMGWEWWIEDKDKKTPCRVKKETEIPSTVGKHNGKTNKNGAKFFWSFIIYNFETKTFQIFNVTQGGIQDELEKYARNPKWGSPVGTDGYDITIERSGNGFDTTYSVVFNPKEKLPEMIMNKWEKTNIDLNALYAGKDPFENMKDDNASIPEDARNDVEAEVESEEDEVNIDDLPF